jgi:hypothetical protein
VWPPVPRSFVAPLTVLARWLPWKLLLLPLLLVGATSMRSPVPWWWLVQHGHGVADHLRVARIERSLPSVD